MRLTNSDRRYGAVALSLHWIVAGLVFAAIAIAAYMTDLPLGPDAIEVYNLHKSLGILILVLMVPRLLWRLVSPAPPLPDSMAGAERLAAKASHLLLYCLLLAQPVIGILHSNAANFPIVVFDSLTLPPLIGPDDALKNLLTTIHGVAGWTILGLVLLHIAAALRHHLVLKDDILRRMLPGRGR